MEGGEIDTWLSFYSPFPFSLQERASSTSILSYSTTRNGTGVEACTQMAGLPCDFVGAYPSVGSVRHFFPAHPPPLQRRHRHVDQVDKSIQGQGISWGV